jgi:hypothetical protein
MGGRFSYTSLSEEDQAQVSSFIAVGKYTAIYIWIGVELVLIISYLYYHII